MNSETRRKLLELGLEALAESVELQQRDHKIYDGLPFEERIQIAVDYLYTEKMNKSIRQMTARANLRQPNADLSSLIFQADGKRDLNRSKVLELMNCQYIQYNRNIILEGPTGCGKTYFACMLGKAACQHRYRTRYVRFSDLMDEYDQAMRKENGKQKILRKYTGFKLLIIDEWLMQEINSSQENFLFNLSDRRENTGSTIFCTQYRLSEWEELLGEDVQAQAIYGRFSSNSDSIQLGEADMRTYISQQGLKSGL